MLPKLGSIQSSVVAASFLKKITGQSHCLYHFLPTSYSSSMNTKLRYGKLERVCEKGI